MINEAIKKLSNKEDIGYEMSRDVMFEIMKGEASDVQKSAYLVSLSMKGETIDEITGSAEAMRAMATRLNTGCDTLEIVGTGGDRSFSYNISSTSAFVIAAGGVKITKHGNRSASSKSGAADVLEALGVNISIEPEKNEEVFKDTGYCFLFAQKYHSAMKYVGPIRKELGIRTVFNILGPLTNPAYSSKFILGVYDETLLDPIAQVLIKLGAKRGMVVYGMEKLDEISSVGPTKVVEFDEEGNIRRYTVTPEQFGLQKSNPGDLTGGTPEENAEITRRILKGEERGPKRDCVLLNAGAGLYIGGAASSMEEGIKLAAELIDSGKAYAKLEEVIKDTNAA
ncbi:MAG: anthranilate phosphoribosyltransferase [Lachnospiraceae bacterium]|nr:anthranilate phosphoribosyltransferase [Lachnospiraceae bacterium]